MDKIKELFKNKALIGAVVIFELLVIVHALSILYVVLAESSVSFRNGFDFSQGTIAVITMTVVCLILNVVLVLLALTNLRTTSVLIPIGILSAIFIYFLFFSGAIVADLLGPVALGAFIGIYYAILFFGPAIWAYFRFRMAYISVGWLSVLYLSTVLVANANKIDSHEIAALLRPDYLAMTAIFFLLAMFLLIVDNTQALARWKRIPQKTVGLPWQTLIPIFITLIVATILTNFLAPMIWRVLWEEGGNVDVGGSDKTGDKDVPKDGDGGPAGNTKVEKNADGSDTAKINNENPLKDKLENQSGNGNIFFIVKATYSYGDYSSDGVALDHAPNGGNFYWKAQNMGKYDKKKGFYSEILYERQSYKEFTLGKDGARYFSYFDYGSPQSVTGITQIYTMIDLESPWTIAATSPDRMRLLTGEARDVYQTDSYDYLTEKSYPWNRGDAYEIESDISRLNTDKLSDAAILRSGYKTVKYNSSEVVPPEYSRFDDDEIFTFTKSIIGTQTNRFDIAKKIETYLRDNYEFTLEPGSPPDVSPETEGLDRLKYFLFENKKGYCTYYASAMVAMLRSVGIPSRMVGGFTEGQFSEELEAFIVTGGNAHAWVEVYFGDYGWITFDPTTPFPDFEKQNKEEMEKKLTEQVKEKLKEQQKESDDQKKDFDHQVNEIVTPTPPPEFPQWVNDLADFIERLMRAWIEVQRVMFFIYVLLIGALISGLPPLINVIIEADLEGKFGKRDERGQIMAMFLSIERMLRKFDKRYKVLSHETALTYFKRIYKLYPMDSVMLQSLEQACIVYNRAAFRYKLEATDYVTMETVLKNVKVWVENNADSVKKLISWWIL